MRTALGVFLGLSISVVALGSQSYVLAIDDTSTTISAGMSIERVVALRHKYTGRFLWARRGNKTWMIRDPQWLDRAAAFFAEQSPLAAEQEAVAREEEELDRQADELEDREDEASRVRVDEIHRRLEEVSRRERELDERQDELEREAESKLWSLIDDAIKQGVARALARPRQ
jgi:hypothetical protein